MTGPGWAGPGFGTPYADPELPPGNDPRLGQLAANAAEAADRYGPASPEHDRAMAAYADAEAEAG